MTIEQRILNALAIPEHEDFIPGIHAGRFAEALDVEREIVSNTLRKLRSRGLVEFNPRERLWHKAAH